MTPTTLLAKYGSDPVIMKLLYIFGKYCPMILEIPVEEVAEGTTPVVRNHFQIDKVLLEEANMIEDPIDIQLHAYSYAFLKDLTVHSGGITTKSRLQESAPMKLTRLEDPDAPFVQILFTWGVKIVN